MAVTFLSTLLCSLPFKALWVLFDILPKEVACVYLMVVLLDEIRWAGEKTQWVRSLGRQGLEFKSPELTIKNKQTNKPDVAV